MPRHYAASIAAPAVTVAHRAKALVRRKTAAHAAVDMQAGGQDPTRHAQTTRRLKDQTTEAATLGLQVVAACQWGQILLHRPQALG